MAKKQAVEKPDGARQDPAVQLQRSLLPGLQKAKVSYFVAAAELDPAGMPLFINTLKEQLCMVNNCPAMPPLFKDHSHMSEVFSPNTPGHFGHWPHPQMDEDG